MKKGLIEFLMYYILYRRHGGLRKELNVSRLRRDQAIVPLISGTIFTPLDIGYEKVV